LIKRLVASAGFALLLVSGCENKIGNQALSPSNLSFAIASLVCFVQMLTIKLSADFPHAFHAKAPVHLFPESTLPTLVGFLAK
jgi:hypothetical protein